MQITENYSVESMWHLKNEIKEKIKEGYKVAIITSVMTHWQTSRPIQAIVVYEKAEEEKPELKKVIPVIYRMADNDAAKMGKKVCTTTAEVRGVDEA